MDQQALNALVTDIDNSQLCRQIFDEFPSGVMVLNIDTKLVYYNKRQGQIDHLNPKDVIGKTLLDLYRVGDNRDFPTLRCLFSRQPLVNYPCYYRTHLGRLINSIHNVFPIFSSQRLKGCVCFIDEYGELLNRYNTVNEPKEPGTSPRMDNKHHSFAELVTQDPIMLQIMDIISSAANSPSPIMLCGETGCGKEMFAKAIHDISRRRNKAFMTLNCAAIPETLLEGMLFGTVKGAFTGALDKPGIMEMADGGTIFLDEINSMPLTLQTKMLRAIQDQKIRRVGSTKEKAVSLKIISASNIHPLTAVSEGQMRADLLFRLGVVLVEIPPLRDRPTDIPLLIKHFIRKLNRRLGKNIERVSPELMDAFNRYHWPGNVRELEHSIEAAMNIIADGEQILRLEHFRSSLLHGVVEKFSRHPQEKTEIQNRDGKMALSALGGEDEAIILEEALKAANYKAARAARSLGISAQLMNYKMNKYGLKKKR